MRAPNPTNRIRLLHVTDTAARHCLEQLASSHPKFELDESTRSTVQFEGAHPEAVPCDVYAPVDLDDQVGVMVDVPPEVNELVRLVVHLAGCLYAEDGGGLRHPLRA